MAALTKAEFSASLPSLVRDAAARLASAETSAEVLDARLMATAAYDAAKSAARIATAKRAHDEIIVAVYKAQADALAIESAAKRRLADEYDAAQDRGEVKRVGNSSRAEELPAAADIGLSHKDIHEARQLRWNGTLADAIERLRRLETFLRECCRSGAAARVLMHMDDAAAIACVLDAVTDPHARVSEHAP